jgi:hypothetical protein
MIWQGKLLKITEACEFEAKKENTLHIQFPASKTNLSTSTANALLPKDHLMTVYTESSVLVKLYPKWADNLSMCSWNPLKADAMRVF